jgi:hypothetical protein
MQSMASASLASFCQQGKQHFHLVPVLLDVASHGCLTKPISPHTGDCKHDPDKAGWIGVASAGPSHSPIMLTAIAGLAAGIEVDQPLDRSVYLFPGTLM